MEELGGNITTQNMEHQKRSTPFFMKPSYKKKNLSKKQGTIHTLFKHNPKRNQIVAVMVSNIQQIYPYYISNFKIRKDSRLIVVRNRVFILGGEREPKFSPMSYSESDMKLSSEEESAFRYRNVDIGNIQSSDDDFENNAVFTESELFGQTVHKGKRSFAYPYVYEVIWKEFTYQGVRKSDMKEGRASFGICANREYICVIGGINQFIPLSSCEKYNLDTGKWTFLPHLSEPKMSTNVCMFFNHSIYVFGGIKFDSPLLNEFDLPLNISLFTKTIEVYKIKNTMDGTSSQKWDIVLVNDNIYHGSANSGISQCSEKEIIIFGGISDKALESDCSNVYYFNIETKSFREGESYFYPEAMDSCYRIHNKIFGFAENLAQKDEFEEAAILYSLDTKTSQWITVDY